MAKQIIDNLNITYLWNKMKAYVNGRVESIELSESMTEEEIDTLTPDINDGTSTFPIATEATLGCVAVGDGLSVTDKGLISVGHKHIIETGTDANGWIYEKWSDGTYKAYQDKEETLAETSSTATISTYLQYAQIIPISSNPVCAKTVSFYEMKILRTDSYGWLAKMSASTPKATYRYFTYNANHITPTMTIRHFIEGTWE